MYAQAAQLGFNSVFGAIIKPKAANLEAANLESNAMLQLNAAKFNASQQKYYAQAVQKTAMKKYLLTASYGRYLQGTQKAAMSASGNWSGSTFDAFINDTVQKTNEQIRNLSQAANDESALLNFSADMQFLQAQAQYDIAQANAQGIRDRGRTEGIMAMFGL